MPFSVSRFEPAMSRRLLSFSKVGCSSSEVECSSVQKLNHSHECSDHPLNDPAIVWLSDRTVNDPDAMSLTSSAQGLAVKIRTVVHVKHFRLSGHGPFSLNANLLQPGFLIHSGVG